MGVGWKRLGGISGYDLGPQRYCFCQEEEGFSRKRLGKFFGLSAEHFDLAGEAQRKLVIYPPVIASGAQRNAAIRTCKCGKLRDVKSPGSMIEPGIFAFNVVTSQGSSL
jgi:hypothetical protein